MGGFGCTHAPEAPLHTPRDPRNLLVGHTARWPRQPGPAGEFWIRRLASSNIRLMSRETSDRSELECGVQRVDSITSFISRLQSSHHTQGAGRVYPGVPARTPRWGAGNWTAPKQEMTALCQTRREGRALRPPAAPPYLISEREGTKLQPLPCEVSTGSGSGARGVPRLCSPARATACRTCACAQPGVETPQ